MVGNGISPELMAARVKDNDLVQFKLKMDGLKQRLSGPESKEEMLRETCKDFEAIFISKLWQNMRSTVPKEGYLHSKQEEFYLSMFDKEFSEKMADSGGIGLGDMIFEQLKQKLENQSKETLPPGERAQGIPLERNPRGIPLEKEGQGIPLRQGRGGIALNRRATDLEVMAKVEELARRIEEDHSGEDEV